MFWRRPDRTSMSGFVAESWGTRKFLSMKEICKPLIHGASLWAKADLEPS